MPVLLPFHAVYGSRTSLFVAGEGVVPEISGGHLKADDQPALFLYRQTFVFPGDTATSIRYGVMGLLNREGPAAIFPHERTLPDMVVRHTGLEASSLFFWTNDVNGSLAPLLRTTAPATIEVRDRFGCLHQIWRVTNRAAIHQMQAALTGNELFLADGHHRFAAGWTLATIQIRTPALRTFAAHRLVMDDRPIALPGAITIENGDIDDYWNATPKGHVRFGVAIPGESLRGIQVPRNPLDRNMSVLHDRVIPGVKTRPIRGLAEARQSGRMAFLVQPIAIDDIEHDARRGILLPPKSTDFFPKLAGGLVMNQLQNDNVTPPVAQIPGVR